eukprot:NODE_7353_length_446_cov_130.143223.p3 GENE.NODE_7353_length_446_cov_130.143223~~NODE_7353_length_446_cov_130.143223.p3  ORF type:complete len:85 (-),score=19.19 NODE_7353_length_446_cov_130.143223:174-428(-)
MGHIGFLILPLTLDVCGPSLLYFMALPLDPDEQVPLRPGDDVDLAFRVWALVVSPAERWRCFSGCRRALGRRGSGDVEKVRRSV